MNSTARGKIRAQVCRVPVKGKRNKIGTANQKHSVPHVKKGERVSLRGGGAVGAAFNVRAPVGTQASRLPVNRGVVAEHGTFKVRHDFRKRCEAAVLRERNGGMLVQQCTRSNVECRVCVELER